MLNPIRKNGKNILIILLVISIIILGVSLKKANTYKDKMQEDADALFKESISTAMSGLNIDYASIELDEQSRNYYYSEIISGLAAANKLIPFTSYKDEKSDLAYTLERLELAVTKTNLLELKLETQTGIYNCLIGVNLNPADQDTLDQLNKLIDLLE